MKINLISVGVIASLASIPIWTLAIMLGRHKVKQEKTGGYMGEDC